MCSRARVQRFALSFALAGAALLVPSAAMAAELALVATPAAIEIPSPRSAVQVLLIVRAGDQAISQLKISFFADAAVKVAPATASLASLPASGERAWTFTVTPSEDLVAGALYARLDYRTAGGAGADHVRIAEIKISNRQLPEADAIVAVKVEGVLDTLQQKHPGSVNLILTNKSAAPISIVSAKSSGPSFVTIAPATVTPALEIPPRQTRMLVFNVEATGRVVPGKYLLVFTSDVHVSAGGGIDVTSVATKEISVGVFGESQVLQVLSVPSFLLLPGFLVLITAKMLWDRRLFRKPAEAGDFPWVFPSPEFWVLAIMVSAIVAFLYPRLLKQPSYLEGYGTTDVALVWMLAVVLGVVGYAISMWARRVWLNRQLAKLLSSNDDPLTALDKLVRLGARVELPQYDLTLDGVPVKAFGLDLDTEHAEAWIFPGITVVPKGDIDDDSYEALTAAVNPRQPLSAVLDALRKGAAAEQATLSWRVQGAFTGPRHVKWADVKAAHAGIASVITVEAPGGN